MKYVARILVSLFFLINALISIGCARENFAEGNIPSAAGQAVTQTSAFPGVVMVVAPNGQGLCTGAIISRYAVMTATHCLLTPGQYSIYTRYGIYKTTNRQLNGTGDVDDPRDLALLIFNQEIARDNSEIYSIAAQVAEGDAVTVVGYGCNSVVTRKGAGQKRMGTNRIAEKASDFLRLLTPKTTSTVSAQGARGIIGDANQAGTCFGDSGGPMFRANGSDLEIAGVTHAGGSYSNYYVSEFVNVADNEANRSFLAEMNDEYGLGIAGI